MSDATRPVGDDPYLTGFDPGAYLRTYYGTPGVAEDEALNLRALIKLLARPGLPLGRCLEVGCGPTVHHALPLAPHAGEVHLSDYLPGNLAEVRKWLDDASDAHDWSAYVRGVLELEGVAPTAEAVRRRAADLRAKVTALLPCDLLRDDPLGRPGTYDLVTCFYTAECAARDRGEWGRVMRRLAGLVGPGGTLFQVSMRNCRHYAVHDRAIPAVPVNEGDFAAVLPGCGFDPGATSVTPVAVAEWAGHGFDGVCVVTATKP